MHQQAFVSPARPPAQAPAGLPVTCSPLVLSDRLISLAKDAERAGLLVSAARLIGLAYSVLDDEGTPVSLC